MDVEKEKWREDWYNYFLSIKKEIKKFISDLFEIDENDSFRVFINRKNRHIAPDKINDYPFWRYVALEDGEISELNNLKKEEIKKFFSVDLFGRGFISPEYKPTELMLFIRLEDYFEDISDSDATNYIEAINSLLSDESFKHYRNYEEAERLKHAIDKVSNSDKNYFIRLVKYMEREALLKNYKDGCSIMIDVSIGVYYTMALFVVFNKKTAQQLGINKFFRISKGKKYFTLRDVLKRQVSEDLINKLLQLHYYVHSQILFKMFTRLFSLLTQYNLRDDFNDIVKRSLSIIFCIPEDSIKEDDIKNQSDNAITIKIGEKEYQIPIYFYWEVNDKEQYKKIKEQYKKITENYLESFKKEIETFYKNILKPYLQAHVKTTLSSIIARNHSHHIGSHVMPRATLGKVIERLKSLNLDSKLKEEGKKLRKLKKLINRAIILKDRLDNYIQKKADFLAEISTEPFVSTKTAFFVREIIYPFVSNTLLMDNICRNEGLGYPDTKNEGCTLKIIPYYNNQQIEMTLNCHETSCETFNLSNYPYSGTCYEHMDELIIGNITEGKDFEVALPGPLGECTFYCILENYIRNAAKHNVDKLRNNNSNNSLEIKINVSSEGDDYYYTVQIWDNLTEDKNISIEKDGKEIKSLKDLLDYYIHQPLIKEDGQMIPEAWGIKEMKIMATLLRGSDDFLNMDDNLKVITIKDGGKSYLGYEFKIMKPKKVAIIGFNNGSKMQIHQPENGIWHFKNIDEYKDHFKDKKSRASFEFILFDEENTADNSIDKEFLSLLPFRVLTNSESSKIPGAKLYNSGILSNASQDIYKEVWRKWLEALMREKSIGNPSLVVYLQQNEEDLPTKKWNVFKLDEFNVKVFYTENLEDVLSTIQNYQYNIVYDRHFGIIEKLNNGILQGLKKALIFHEIIEKNSSDFVNIFREPDYELVFGMFEAGLLDVLVVDERITEYAYEEIIDKDKEKFANNLYGSINRISVSKGAGIFIATHFKIDGKEIPIHESAKDKNPRVIVELKKQKEEINGITNILFQNGEGQQEVKPDIFIIHQGILENEELKIKRDTFIDNVRGKIPYIVVDSGRGIPPELLKETNTEKFIPFSLLSNWLLKSRVSKYSLVKTLMSLIRIKGGD